MRNPLRFVATATVFAVATSLCVATTTAATAAAQPSDQVIGTVTIPADKQQLSVTVYDAAGKQPVRTLLEAKPKQASGQAETVELRWDGLDDHGYPVRPGKYS